MSSYVIENGQIINRIKEITLIDREPTSYIRGNPGPPGPPGPPLLIKGNLNSVADLPNNPAAGDGYLIQGILYTWTGSLWVNGGQIQGPQGPKGDTGLQGIQGSPGPANTLSIGTVTTGEAGSNASVTISGTPPSQVLDFSIPSGIQGIQGERGIQGSPGPANTLSIGTVTTGQPGSNASVTISGTPPSQVLDFSIPSGIQGIQGIEGERGIQGIQGPPGIIGEQSWTINLGVLRENSAILEGSAFPKSFTFSPLGKPSTLLRVIGLVSLIGGTAVVTFQKGTIGSFTNIGGLTNLGVNQTPVDFSASGANNSLQAGERVRLLFSSITGAISLSFTIIYTEP